MILILILIILILNSHAGIFVLDHLLQINRQNHNCELYPAFKKGIIIQLVLRIYLICKHFNILNKALEEGFHEFPNLLMIDEVMETAGYHVMWGICPKMTNFCSI